MYLSSLIKDGRYCSRSTEYAFKFPLKMNHSIRCYQVLNNNTNKLIKKYLSIESNKK